MRLIVTALWVTIMLARVGLLGHPIEQLAEALDIGVVERCVDLVEHADRRGDW